MISASDTAQPEHLFVYGSLRRGAPNSMHWLIADVADRVGPASWRGRLYRVASYPGAVASEAPGDRVRGELYAIRAEHHAALLERLDRYEGSDYRREPARVRLESGDRREAWIYVYVRSVAGLARIASGDFLSGATP